MRKLIDIPNVDGASSDYPSGRIRNKNNAIAPPVVGTPIVEELYGDLIQTVYKLCRDAGISYNDLPDNVTNGYQLLYALVYKMNTEFANSLAAKFDNWQNTTIGGEIPIVSNFSKHLKLPRTLIINLYLEITKGALLSYISLITSDYVVSISQSGANDLGTSGFCLCYDRTSAIYIPCYIALAGITTHTQTLMEIRRIDGLNFVSGHVYLITGSITAKSFIA